MRLALFLLLPLCACTPASPPPADATSVEVSPSTAEPRADFLRAAVGSSREAIDHADIRRLLGEPQRVDVETRPNQHVDGATDTLRTFVYPGLTATAFSGTASPNRFLTRIVITHAGIETPHDVRVGQPLEDVIARRGDPSSRRDDGSLAYEIPATEADPTPPYLVVVPDASGERVAEVHYLMYTG